MSNFPSAIPIESKLNLDFNHRIFFLKKLLEILKHKVMTV